MAWGNDQIRDRVIRTLLGESNGTPEGMTSVAHVMKNRADSGAWGQPNGGLTRVITAPKQFSMWNTDDPKLRSLAASVNALPTTDLRYQRAAAIADGVFGDQIPDPTGGATHYHTTSVAPDWSQGVTPTATIGGHYFYKLPLTASNTAGTAVTSPSSVGMGTSAAPTTPTAPPIASVGVAGAGAISRAVADAHALLGKNEVPDHDMLADYLKTGGQNLDPHQSAWCAAFVSASLQREGLPVPDKIVADSQFAGGANARDYLNYGQGVTDPGSIQAGDILVAKDGSHVGFAEGPVRQGANGPEVQILAGNEKDTSGQYTPGSWTNPRTGQVAGRAQVGMVGERWAPVSDFVVRRAPDADAAGPASSAAPAAAASGAVPSAQAQPMEAVAPPGASPIPGPAASPSAGFVGPGSDKYSVVSGMTSGTGRNPQLTTAANWGNLFGGATPSASPASAPAATAPSSQPAPDLQQRVPLAKTPIPPARPTDATATGNAWSQRPSGVSPSIASAPLPPERPVTLPSLSAADFRTPASPALPLTSTLPTVGSTATYSDDNEKPAPMPGGMDMHPAYTPGQPSLGFPAMQNPFGDPSQQISQLPGSMLSSAQNLIKLLFPSNVG
jgi:N-acetylmuramoyl-L-alanine amidase